MTEVLVGRQPIFDRYMKVYAYELLYRSGDLNSANFQDGDQATTQVILNTLLEMGLDSIVGDAKAFINLTRNFLTGKYPIPLPANRIVIEILEDIKIDDQVISAARDLHNSGFTLALDDVSNTDRVTPFCGISSIVKLDLKQIDFFTLPDAISRCRECGFKVLVEKVETQGDYNMCRRLGVDYYQGYFLCKPNIMRGKKKIGRAHV